MANYTTRRRKYCRFTTDGVVDIDYKDVNKLREYMTEAAKIVPSRVTGTAARYQRQITEAIKRARFLALLPYTDRHQAVNNSTILEIEQNVSLENNNQQSHKIRKRKANKAKKSELFDQLNLEQQKINEQIYKDLLGATRKAGAWKKLADGPWILGQMFIALFSNSLAVQGLFARTGEPNLNDPMRSAPYYEALAVTYALGSLLFGATAQLKMATVDKLIDKIVFDKALKRILPDDRVSAILYLNLTAPITPKRRQAALKKFIEELRPDLKEKLQKTLSPTWKQILLVLPQIFFANLAFPTFGFITDATFTVAGAKNSFANAAISLLPATIGTGFFNSNARTAWFNPDWQLLAMLFSLFFNIARNKAPVMLAPPFVNTVNNLINAVENPIGRATLGALWETMQDLTIPTALMGVLLAVNVVQLARIYCCPSTSKQKLLDKQALENDEESLKTLRKEGSNNYDEDDGTYNDLSDSDNENNLQSGNRCCWWKKKGTEEEKQTLRNKRDTIDATATFLSPDNSSKRMDYGTRKNVN